MIRLLALLLAAAPACPEPGRGAPDDETAALARVLRKLRATAAKSVVAIEVDRTSDPDGGFGPGATSAHRDYYNRPKGPTSGVIYESDGYILTSYFNVSGGIRKNGIRVTLGDEREFVAELRGFDEQRDMALLKIDAKDLPVLPKADFKKELGQGTFLALIGRSPDPGIPTVNVGILSAMDRMKKSHVQTDAEMNYGNAGGALVTLEGKLVGVACKIRPGTVWGQSGGVGFACKVPVIDSLLERLKRGEKIEAEKKPFLGIRPGEGDPKIEGVQVADVLPGSPARRAGIKTNDVIVEFDGKKITDSESLREAMAEKKIGDQVTIKIKRKRRSGGIDEREFRVKLAGAPER